MSRVVSGLVLLVIVAVMAILTGSAAQYAMQGGLFQMGFVGLIFSVTLFIIGVAVCVIFFAAVWRSTFPRKKK